MTAKTKMLLTMLICSVFLVISAIPASTVSADITWGSGKPPSSGGVGKWPWVKGAPWDSEGTARQSEAWKKFKNAHIGRSDDLFNTEAKFNSFVGKLASAPGFRNPDGTRMTFLESCQKSTYIWWYGYAENGKTWWYTEAGKNDTHPPTGMDPTMKAQWNNYLSLSGNKWGKNPGPIIVCSGPTGTAKRPLVLTARSNHSLIYDGTFKRVSGWDLTSGSTLAGDSIVAKASGGATEPGRYMKHVKFRTEEIVPHVLDSKGVDVTKKRYTIKLVNGGLTITKKEEEPVNEEFYRCLISSSDSVSAITMNTLSLTPKIDPSGLLEEMIAERDTPAKGMIEDSLPPVNSSKSSWNSFKTRLTAVGSDRRVDLNLNNVRVDGEPVSTIFSQYGGILNAALTHDRMLVNVVFCQPETRSTYYVPMYSNGYFVGYAGPYYTEWAKAGEEIIYSINVSDLTPELASYQILGMNCNNDAYLAAKASAQVDGSTVKEKYFEGKVVSGFFKTQTIKNSHSFPLGNSGPAAYMSSYTDSPTCINNKLCTVQRTSGNESANNDLNLPLFQQLQGTEKLPTDEKTLNGKLTFFRDFQERTVRLDLWRLRASSSGIITNPNASPKRAFAKVFPGGTPEYSITVIKEPQKDDASKFIVSNIEEVAVTPNSLNKIVFKSQWASLDNKPYKVGMNWIYEVEIERFGVSAVSDTGISSFSDKDIVDISCMFVSSSTADRNGLINEMPHTFQGSYLPAGALHWATNESAKVIFSRGVSDKRN